MIIIRLTAVILRRAVNFKYGEQTSLTKVRRFRLEFKAKAENLLKPVRIAENRVKNRGNAMHDGNQKYGGLQGWSRHLLTNSELNVIIK